MLLDSILNFFIEPLSFAFMQRALAMILIISVVCAIFSCFLILKGWALMGDAVSHAVLPGIGLAYIFGIPLMLGAFIAGLFCSISIGYIKEHSRVKEDAVMGIVFSGMFAAGLIMVAKVQTDVHLLHVLFGNVLGVSVTDLWQSGVIAVLASTVMYLRRHDFLLYCFDSQHAQVIGISSKWLHYLLLLLLSATIVSAIQSVGIVLVTAMLIGPGATAFLSSQRFQSMLLIAVSLAIVCSFFGLIMSFHWDVATAPLIVLLQILCFIIALVRFLLRQRNISLA